MSKAHKMWDDKPYFSLNSKIREKYGCKLYKISLNGGMTCPNRDGSKGTRGCLFCSEGGSGEFTPSVKLSMQEQIAEAKVRVQGKMTGVSHSDTMPQGELSEQKYIAYFQAYTNTYASAEYLRELYEPITRREDIAILSIATRPDCLNTECLELLEELNMRKPVWVELGLQTMHDDTAELIRRGYRRECFEEAVEALRSRNIEVIVHLIFGLPGEDKKRMLASVDYLAGMDIQGIKLQLLHVLKGTDLEQWYKEKRVETLSLEEYAELITLAVARLPQNIAVHRLTGDGPRDLLIAPLWSTDKKRVLNTIMKRFRDSNRYQGCLLEEENEYI